MKDWAIEKADALTHLLYPMTGLTAEKHDSFVVPTGDGRALAKVPEGTDPRRARRQFVSLGWGPQRHSKLAVTPPGTRRAPRSFSKLRTAHRWSSPPLSSRGPVKPWIPRLPCSARWKHYLIGACAFFVCSETTGSKGIHDGRARAGVLPD